MALLQWNKKKNVNAKMQIQRLKQEIIEKQKDRDNRKIGIIRELKRELAKAYKKEEIYWGQKETIKWLKESDKNTK